MEACYDDIFHNIEDVRPIANSIGAGNIMFIMPVLPDSYKVHCSCGCSFSARNTRNLICPDCGNRLSYIIDNDRDDSVLIGYDYNVVQDDDHFLVVQIIPFGFEIIKGSIRYAQEDIDDVIIFDKKLHFLAMGQLDDKRLAGERTDTEYLLNGKRTGYLSTSIYSVVNYFNNWSDCFFEEHQIDYSGLKELFVFLNSYLKTNLSFCCFYDLESMIVALMKRYNIPCGKDNDWVYELFGLNKHNNKYSYVFCRMMRILDCNIDITADTIEKMLNMKEEYVILCNSFDNYLSFRPVYEELKKENLLTYYSQYVKMVAPEISLIKLMLIHQIATNANKPFSKILKYFVRSMLNGFSYQRIEDLFKHTDSIEEILERNFSVALEKEFLLLDNDVLNKEQIKSIHNKPTLTNVYNLICCK